MIVRDWRPEPSAALAPVYAREQATWHDALAWETSTSWQAIETARTTWGLPGLVCLDDDGRIRGWTYYLPRASGVDVGGLAADSPDATRALVEALLGAVTPGAVRGLMYAGAPALERELRNHGLAVGRYLYMMRDTTSAPDAENTTPHPAAPPSPRHDGTLREWSVADIAATAALLQRAYGAAGARLVPGNQAQGWSDYVHQIVVHEGCGVLAPALSRSLWIDGQLTAVAMVSMVAPMTAHLVQLAVAPSHRRGGLAQRMLHEATVAAGAAGATALSLLVAEDNPAALQLYTRAGFTPRASFVAILGD
jgi:ribosomal protein S18 acetylase RimI-like enzyme